MIDHRAIRFFQHLPRLPVSDNSFFTAVSDISSDHLSEMYTVAQTIHLPKREQKKYMWFRSDATGNLYSKDLCNTNGVPAHDHYQKMFKNKQSQEDLELGTYTYNKDYNSNAQKIEWLPEYEVFKNALDPIGKQWRWCLLIRIDPMGWWSPKHNHPTLGEQQDYKMYWIPLNQVKNRLIAATNVGYFEPNLGKIYTLDGVNYQYSTINLGLEPMYNLLGTCIK